MPSSRLRFRLLGFAVAVAAALSLSSCDQLAGLPGMPGSSGVNTPDPPDLAFARAKAEFNPEYLNSTDVSFIIVNFGPSASTETSVTASLQTGPEGTPVELLYSDEWLVPAIDSGGSLLFELTVYWEEPLGYGDHHLVFEIDKGGKLGEANTENNTYSVDLGMRHPCPNPEAVWAFEDAAMGLTVAETLSLSVDEVTCDELANLRTIWVSRDDVTSLVDLRSSHRLWSLSVGSPAVTDLTPVADLPLLSSLDITGSGIKLTHVAEVLPGLKGLRASSYALSELGFVSSFPELRDLDVSYNEITDLGPLSGTGVTQLSLSGNPLADISLLTALPYLRSVVLGNMPRLEDWSPLGSLTGLTDLGVPSNGFTDLSALHAVSGLASLDLGYNRLKDLSGLTEIMAEGPEQGWAGYVTLWGNCLDLREGSAARLLIAELENQNYDMYLEDQNGCSGALGR